jgi:two-component system sensor histidine kinase SaeS
MNNRHSFLFYHPAWRALSEGAIGLIPALFLVFSVLAELPPTNIPNTILFLVQIPILWSALRLSLSQKLDRHTFLGELGSGVILRLISLGWMVGFVLVFHAQTYFQNDFSFSFILSILFYSATLLPWLIYRLVFYGIRAWFRFTHRSLLWTLVNSYLAAIFLVTSLILLCMWSGKNSQSVNTVYPTDPLAAAVLTLVRGLIPRVGVSLFLIMIVLALVLPPAIGLSYLTARHFSERIRDLAQAMHRTRTGDLSVRVAPKGSDEVAQLQEDFNQMTADLQSKRDQVDTLLNNQRELAAVVSHELRTPLAVMRATLETDMEVQEKGKTVYPESLVVLHQETLQLQSLVEDLFTLSQLDSQRLTLECSWQEPQAILMECAIALQPLAWKNKRIDLSTALPDFLPLVWVDPNRLTQVLNNLLQNAIRHTPTGGVILLQAVDLGTSGVEISVKDSGEGIAAKDMPHIWERYYRGGDDRHRQSGRTGIGLSLVKQLVEAMGGMVGVESIPRNCSRFWLRLRSQQSEKSELRQ